MTKTGGNNQPRERLPWQKAVLRYFLRFIFLLPFFFIFTVVLVSSIIELSAGMELLKSRLNRFLDITEDVGIYKALLLSVIGGFCSLIAVVVSVIVLLIYCAKKCCSDRKKHKDDPEEVPSLPLLCMGLFLLVLSIFLLAGFVLSLDTAIEFSFKTESEFVKSFRKRSLESFQDYVIHNSTRHSWNKFQTKHHCCGITNWRDYRKIFNNDTVVSSCCNTTTINNTVCESVRMNVTSEIVAKDDIYNEGCLYAAYELDGSLLRKHYVSSLFNGISAGVSLLFLIAGLVAVYVWKCHDDGCERFINYENL